MRAMRFTEEHVFDGPLPVQLSYVALQLLTVVGVYLAVLVGAYLLYIMVWSPSNVTRETLLWYIVILGVSSIPDLGKQAFAIWFRRWFVKTRPSCRPG